MTTLFISPLLAENEKYDEAKELTLKLFEQAPIVAEYHRILTDHLELTTMFG